MPTARAFQQYLHDILAFDRSKIAVGAGLRKAVVIATPLIAGVLLNQPGSATLVALGALVTGFADQGGAYRSRARVLLLVCAWVSFSALVGGTVGRIGWSAAPLMALWGFVAGLMVAVSQAASAIALQSVVMLAVAINFMLAPMQVVGAAGLILLGGLAQTVCSLTLWPLRRYGPERAALSTLYEKLATNAERLPNIDAEHQASDALAGAGATIAASVPRYGSGAAADVFQGLLTKAWSIYLQLTALVEARDSLAAQHQTNASQPLDRLQAAAATILRAIADGLSADKPPVGLDEPLEQIEQALRALRQPVSDERAAAATALKEAEALGGSLRAAARIAASWAATGKSAAPDHGARPPPALQPQSVFDILRANFTLRSATFRHAIRMSAALACATLLYRFFPLDRGYWAPLTVVVVLRPDFSTTITRGLARGLGTLLGGVCIGLLFVLLRPNPLTLTLIAGLLVWAAQSVFLANYVIFAFVLTAFVAALVSLSGAPPLQTVEDRVIDTLIGIALAIGSIIIWPTWSRVQAREALVKLLDADRAYFAAVMDGYLRPQSLAHATLRERRLQARLARSNAEATVQLSLRDPARYHTNARVALGVLESAQQFMRSVFAIETLRHEAQSCQKPPELAALSADVQRALHLLAEMIADEAIGAPLPPLRQRQQALARQIEAAHQEKGEPAHCAFLVTETDHIVDSLTSMGDLLQTEAL